MLGFPQNRDTCTYTKSSTYHSVSHIMSPPIEFYVPNQRYMSGFFLVKTSQVSIFIPKVFCPITFINNFQAIVKSPFVESQYLQLKDCYRLVMLTGIIIIEIYRLSLFRRMLSHTT